jgi:hypothetical protein
MAIVRGQEKQDMRCSEGKCGDGAGFRLKLSCETAGKLMAGFAREVLVYEN